LYVGVTSRTPHDQDALALNPAGHHSLAVALKADVRSLLEGPVGWYEAGMNHGPHVAVHCNCGLGLAECQIDGRVQVFGHAGSGAAASIRGGLVYVAGISRKGGRWPPSVPTPRSVT
jgi:glutamate synthase domain-containing protein 3